MTDEEDGDELPPDLDTTGLVGPYMFPNNNRQLKVTIRDSKAKQFFSKLVTGGQSIGRSSLASDFPSPTSLAMLLSSRSASAKSSRSIARSTMFSRQRSRTILLAAPRSALPSMIALRVAKNSSFHFSAQRARRNG